MITGIEVGKLDRRITLQTRTVAANEYNDPIETWTDLATVWAMVEYPKTHSEEVYMDNVNIAVTATEFTIRYRDDYGFVERISYNDELYDIERIYDLDRRRYQKILAKRR